MLKKLNDKSFDSAPSIILSRQERNLGKHLSLNIQEGILNIFNCMTLESPHKKKKLAICLHLLKKTLMENFIFCAVNWASQT